MGIQKEREAFQRFCEENFDFERHEQTYFDEQTQCYENDIGEDTESINMAWSAWQAARAQAVLECTWVKNEDGYFDASCGQSFVFSEPEDKPSSHEFTHCCFCGGKLIEAQEPTND